MCFVNMLTRDRFMALNEHFAVDFICIKCRAGMINRNIG